MMPPVVEVLIVVAANFFVVWFVGYLVHSSILIAAAYAAERFLELSATDRALAWRISLCAPPISALLQIGVAGAQGRTLSDASVLAGHAALLLGEHVPIAVGVVFVTAALLLFAIMLLRFGHRAFLLSLAREDVRNSKHSETLAELTRAAGLRHVRLTASPLLSVPAAVGQSEVCIPKRVLLQMPPDEQRALLAHEVGHLMRSDPIWIGLAATIARVAPFQPLNRLALRRLSHATEEAADDAAVTLTAQGPALARALAALASGGVVPLGLSGAGAPLLQRVSRLLSPEGMIRRLPSRSFRLHVAVTLAGVIAFAPSIAVTPKNWANAIPWLAPSSALPGERLLEVRCAQRRLFRPTEECSRPAHSGRFT